VAAVRIYLDTIGWNALYDSSYDSDARFLEENEVVFSSCNLDESCLSNSDRARDLLAFAWRASNKKKLLDHLELTAVEIRGRQTNEEPSPFDDDPAFMQAWEYMRQHGIPPDMHEAMKRGMIEAKRHYRSHLRTTRDVFRPIFDRFAEIGIKQAWPQMLNEMDRDGSITEWIIGLLKHEGLLSRIPDPAGVAEISFRDLPGTACWVEYCIGLAYLAAFESGSHTKPDLGDQIDFRHATYAGIADVFVTADGRMEQVLTDMVIDRRAQIVQPDGLAGLVQ
jgi:hypothetical protein